MGHGGFVEGICVLLELEPGNKTIKNTLGIAIHAMDNTAAFNLVTQRKEIITQREKPDLTKLPEFQNEPEIQRIYRAIATNDFARNVRVG